MQTPPHLLGRWDIESMDMWDADAINLVEQGHITVTERGGEMTFICVNLWLDCRPKGTTGTAATFTFEGTDEGDEVSGSGHVKVNGKDTTGGSTSAPRALRRVSSHRPLRSGAS